MNTFEYTVTTEKPFEEAVLAIENPQSQVN